MTRQRVACSNSSQLKITSILSCSFQLWPSPSAVFRSVSLSVLLLPIAPARPSPWAACSEKWSKWALRLLTWLPSTRHKVCVPQTHANMPKHLRSIFFLLLLLLFKALSRRFSFLSCLIGCSFVKWASMSRTMLVQHVWLLYHTHTHTHSRTYTHRVKQGNHVRRLCVRVQLMNVRDSLGGLTSCSWCIMG